MGAKSVQPAWRRTLKGTEGMRALAQLVFGITKEISKASGAYEKAKKATENCR
jgi:hypothetical protein